MQDNPLISVVKDLWYFVINETRSWLFLPQITKFLESYPQPQLISATKDSPLLLDSGSSAAVAHDVFEEVVLQEFNEAEVFTDIDHVEYDTRAWIGGEELNFREQYFESYEPAVMYVKLEQALCIARPQRDFDTVLAKFPYGTAVTVTGYLGNYAKVFWSHHEGWIRKDDLTPHKAEVWPHVTSGVVYEADSEVVKKLRLLIADTFYAKELALPLQAGEWVVYRLREQNRLIPWPVLHGRLPGDWQALLRGVPGVHIAITPKSDSIMEWRGSDGIGRVAYVEKLSPEKTLTISIAGLEEPGRFEEKIFLENEWRELRPVFIEVL